MVSVVQVVVSDVSVVCVVSVVQVGVSVFAVGVVRGGSGKTT